MKLMYVLLACCLILTTSCSIREREQALEKRADELAGQARAAKKPLAEVFAGQPDLKVTETAPFSWLTTGNVP